MYRFSARAFSAAARSWAGSVGWVPEDAPAAGGGAAPGPPGAAAGPAAAAGAPAPACFARSSSIFFALGYSGSVAGTRFKTAIASVTLPSLTSVAASSIWDLAVETEGGGALRPGWRMTYQTPPPARTRNRAASPSVL